MSGPGVVGTMRIPERPPTEAELMQKVMAEPGLFARILSKVPDPTVGERYLHWDKLRHRTPPDGLTPLEWWFGLKLRRGQARPVPLRDPSGLAFKFNQVDPLPKCLYLVDSLGRGFAQMPEVLVNPETRERYLVRSLIEEAIASSQLEGASTTRDVAREMIRQGRSPRDRGERMIDNNYKTMQSIRELKKTGLSPDIVFDIHRMVTAETLEDPTGAGRFRRDDEKVVVEDVTGEVLHEPPPASELAERMGLMCRFANGEVPDGFIHPLIRSMILHFWLAYDHPFIDGNGRTARALFYWSMLRQGYWLFEYISISNIILKGPKKYGTAFLYTESDENDLTYFLLYHAKVVRRAIDELHAYISRRSERLARAEGELRGLTMLNHRQRDVIGHALRHPEHTYTVESHRRSQNVVYETARSDLMDLEARGLLLKRKAGKTWHFRPAPDLETKLRTP